jgi:hypothetical protein
VAVVRSEAFLLVEATGVTQISRKIARQELHQE